MQRLVAEAAEFGDGALDVLVNNAGLGGTATLAEMTDEQWFSVLDVTLTGTMRMTRAALRHMGEQRFGRDREQRLRRRLARPGGPVALRGREGRGHGADALRRARGGREQRAGERGRAVARHAPVPRQGHHRGAARRAREREAFGRAAEPWEVANVIIFLASDLASYMTGEVVSVSSQHP